MQGRGKREGECWKEMGRAVRSVAQVYASVGKDPITTLYFQTPPCLVIVMDLRFKL